MILRIDPIIIITALSFDRVCTPPNRCSLKSLLNPIQEPLQPARRPVHHKYPYTIVTAASGNHFCSLENFLYNLHDLRQEISEEEFPRVVVYNIGFNRTHFPILDQLHANGLIDENVIFDFDDYPSFWDVNVRAGEYGWKAGIIEEVRQKYGGVILWLDSGDQATKDFLRTIPHYIRRHGFWSPRSSSNMGTWTHQGLFDYYGVEKSDYQDYINCNGAIIGFDTKNATIVNEIMVPWYQCSLDKDCIAPRGSSRHNHRQDQAALTFLVYKSGRQCFGPPNVWGISTHKDVNCKTDLQQRRLDNKLFLPSSLDMPKWEKADSNELALHPEWRYPNDEMYVEHIATS
ncbi:hypothetical protein BGW37DRAFT_519376 [Umbelopsis sp. PMI_123]|nr:hypothetical protein BGW37DRAFT_519376 [Umbelopsis sp. PMI_123]